jgi:anti-sigma B factor antagonist
MDPANSKIFVEHTPDVTIVTLNDKTILQEEQIKEIEKSIMLIVEQARRLDMILDFCHVKFMSSSFLGLLVKIHKKMCDRKGRLQLCNVDPNLYKIFEITQLSKVFDISRKPKQ